MCSRIQRRLNAGRSLRDSVADRNSSPPVGERRVDAGAARRRTRPRAGAAPRGCRRARDVHLPVAVGVPVDARPRLGIGRGRAAPRRTSRLVERDVLQQPPSVIVEGASGWASCSRREALGLQPEGVAVVVEEGDEGRGLVGREGRVGAPGRGEVVMPPTLVSAPR